MLLLNFSPRIEICSTVHKIWTNFASLYNKIPQGFDLTDMAAMTHSQKQKHGSIFFVHCVGFVLDILDPGNPLHAPSSISHFFICSAAWLSEKNHRSRSGETTMKRKGSCFTNLSRVGRGIKTPPARGTQRRFRKYTENTIYF